MHIYIDLNLRPALDGTLNVLKAAAEQSSVKRVVLTASGRNIVGFDHTDRLYSEDDWADVIDVLKTRTFSGVTRIKRLDVIVRQFNSGQL